MIIRRLDLPARSRSGFASAKAGAGGPQEHEKGAPR
jgi:hypothetical protein